MNAEQIVNLEVIEIAHGATVGQITLGDHILIDNAVPEVIGPKSIA